MCVCVCGPIEAAQAQTKGLLCLCVYTKRPDDWEGDCAGPDPPKPPSLKGPIRLLMEVVVT